MLSIATLVSITTSWSTEFRCPYLYGTNRLGIDRPLSSTLAGSSWAMFPRFTGRCFEAEQVDLFGIRFALLRLVWVVNRRRSGCSRPRGLIGTKRVTFFILSSPKKSSFYYLVERCDDEIEVWCGQVTTSVLRFDSSLTIRHAAVRTLPVPCLCLLCTCSGHLR
jgi:hypothetical protein